MVCESAKDEAPAGGGMGGDMGGMGGMGGMGM
jgi:chaperonin GroEL